MKILFTADWHIKLGQKNVPVRWARDRFHIMVSEIRRVAETEKAKVLVIGGDVFDKVPSVEELELYFELLDQLPKIKTYIIPGNHEALKKNTTFLSALKKVTSIVNDNIDIIDDFHTAYDMDFIPYNKLKEYSPQDIDFHSDILVTHVRGDIPPHVKAEINLELFERWPVVLAGDLHSYSNSQRNILYPGSPVTTSFHREVVDTGCIILDSETLKHSWHKLNVPQLVKLTVKAGEPTPATDYHHTIYEVEGSLTELQTISDDTLISKKITKRSHDTALILDPDMTLEQEVNEYLQFILQLDTDAVQKVLKELNDISHKFN